MSAGPHSFLEALGKNLLSSSFDVLTELISCGCRTDILLGCYWGPPLAPTGFSLGPYISEPLIAHLIFLILGISLTCVCVCLVIQSCSTLCDPLDCSPPGSSVRRDSYTGVVCHALLQGIFPTRGSNPDLPHCRQIVYCLSHQGSPLCAVLLLIPLLLLLFD